MNSTIRRLALSAASCPVVTLQSSNTLLSFSMVDSQISRSFTPFFVSCLAFSNLRFNRDSFSAFLNSPLRISSLTISAQSINTRKVFDSTSGPIIDLDYCLFSNCSTDEEGGGLSISDTTRSISLHILRSSFALCRSTASHGGAIYFWSQAIYMNMTCFLHCNAYDDVGQAFSVESLSNNSLSINAISVDQCPSNQKLGVTAPAKITDGHQTVYESNFTNNAVEDVYTALSTEDSITFKLSFINFRNNTGSIVFSLDGVRFNDEISHVNILDNIVTDASYGLISLLNQAVTIQTSVFNGNSPILLHSPFKDSKVTFSQCVFDGPCGIYNFTDHINVTMKDCKIDLNSLNSISVFDSRYCWMINPPTLEAGPVTYVMLVFVAMLVGILAYGIIKQEKCEPSVSDYDNVK